ncbi:uncharacterized protein [Triticum aestivum]|uniref:uncharacterized protein isoform X4 n=1 Tax=Triticum aestivum TaxID=4565 RepID=UPI001D00D169|nr:uncharacterized protein LOC123091294 isoform X4 [Triticum aestivum]
MGVLSRKVLPTCGALCYFYPGLRARSRQPVKRYKKILAEIFPRTQDEEPNDRRIGKLCEYAAKNPLRVPKITVYLEQRIYKELRAEQYGFAKVVMLIHRGLLVSCKGQIAHCSALRASATDATIYQSSEIVSIHIQSLDQTTKAAHIITSTFWSPVKYFCRGWFPRGRIAVLQICWEEGGFRNGPYSLVFPSTTTWCTSRHELCKIFQRTPRRARSSDRAIQYTTIAI